MSVYIILALVFIIAVGLDAVAKLMFPHIILPLPAGITADLAAEYGQFALQQNLNAYSITPQAPIATSGTNVNLTGTNLSNGGVILTAGASGGFTITLPSTSAIIAAFGPTIPTNGIFAGLLFIQNNNIGQTGTITAGDASTTLSGTMTIATNTSRLFVLAITSPTTVTITNIGSVSL